MPSSPIGPCSSGKHDDLGRLAAGRDDGGERIDLGARRCRPARAARRAAARSSAAIASSDSHPPAVAGDADGHELVAVGVGGAQHVGAVMHDTSCSADCPPNSTTSRTRSGRATRAIVRSRRVRFRAMEVAAAAGGGLHGTGCRGRRCLDRLACRSEPDSLFVPIVAERDGHEYIADAVESGAAAYLTAQTHRRCGRGDRRRAGHRRCLARARVGTRACGCRTAWSASPARSARRRSRT